MCKVQAHVTIGSQFNAGPKSVERFASDFIVCRLLTGGGKRERERQLKTQNQQKNLSMFANHLHATLSLEIFLKSILNYMRFVKIGSSLGTYILHAQPPLI